jgi:cytidine deaminase
VCAERVAIFKAISEGYQKIRAVAVIAESSTPIPPCGICLQVINEFGPGADIVMGSTEGAIRVCKMRELLPVSFRFPPPRSTRKRGQDR